MIDDMNIVMCFSVLICLLCFNICLRNSWCYEHKRKGIEGLKWKEEKYEGGFGKIEKYLKYIYLYKYVLVSFLMSFINIFYIYIYIYIPSGQFLNL